MGLGGPGGGFGAPGGGFFSLSSSSGLPLLLLSLKPPPGAPKPSPKPKKTKQQTEQTNKKTLFSSDPAPRPGFFALGEEIFSLDQDFLP